MPEPSQLVLLEQLPSIKAGTKIRFLACVHAYSLKQGKLILRDRYPTTTPGAPTAVVSITNVLENTNRELLEVGAWMNVVGYVTKSSVPTEAALVASKQDRYQRTTKPLEPTSVEATMLWSAGAVKLDRYKSAVRGYQKPLSSG
ncbi:hypothetical protein LTR37_011840 [Vermiconidia calcicola]|uniref:Uncharacterized protein n=1 Tax=Vermiconidia calcicola TaxID=1690605 RepID=A0ACC3N2L9_9PEZI|nr:hypothetical protein LTR37_011840 [Vermiconidia calcicola]